MNSSKPPLKEELWEEWFNGYDNEVANKLIQHYMYLVRFHVERIAINLPNSVCKDDLESFALMGLFDAINKFEKDRNLKFDTYASFRIRGSVIDGLRKEDWLPRSLREKTKEVEEVSQQLEQHLQRPPRSSEIAEKIGISSKKVETLIRDSLYANVLSIDQKLQSNQADQSEGMAYMIPDETTTTPKDHVLNIELSKELSDSIKLLNESEQLVISLFYHEELTMTEIGGVLDLTTSRISQIHKQAIFKLRKILKKIQKQN